MGCLPGKTYACWFVLEIGGRGGSRYLVLSINNCVKERLPILCCNCNKTFYVRPGVYANTVLKHKIKMRCSKKCYQQSITTTVSRKCKNCSKDFSVREKCKKMFCSQSCSATYNNTHKTHGNRRSKLEMWLEQQLTKLYPEIKIHYNKKDAINSELDIYIPSLKIAFELNGIYHYEPIHGIQLLEKIQNNDNRKFQACLERDIELCIIDSSNMYHFNEKKAKQYLKIIQDIVSAKNGRGRI